MIVVLYKEKWKIQKIGHIMQNIRCKQISCQIADSLDCHLCGDYYYLNTDICSSESLHKVINAEPSKLIPRKLAAHLKSF